MTCHVSFKNAHTHLIDYTYSSLKHFYKANFVCKKKKKEKENR